MLYSVENYRFYFNGLKSRGAHVAFLIWSQSLCSGIKNEKICYKFGTSEYVLKEFSSFCVCVFFFSFCPKGQLKAVLIAQTHRQQVILYMPSVVPSFVYLLLNCLRRVLVCCICVLNLRFFLGSKCEKMKREMRERFSSFLAVRQKNFMAQHHFFWMYNITLDFYFCVDEPLWVKMEKVFWLICLHFVSFDSQVPFRYRKAEGLG